jgi:hypothetical protein
VTLDEQIRKLEASLYRMEHADDEVEPADYAATLNELVRLRKRRGDESDPYTGSKPPEAQP